jgi:hypothetical protein
MHKRTGAGKTYTMSGNTACYEQRGLIPRVLAALLSSLRTAPGVTSWSLSLSYLEVYNDVLYDLLDINASPSELTLYEEASGQLQVRTTHMYFSRYTVRFLMRAGFEGLSSLWQQGIGSGHSTWAFTVHVRHPMCVRCKE